jgi:hypothetical protein
LCTVLDAGRRRLPSGVCRVYGSSRYVPLSSISLISELTEWACFGEALERARRSLIVVSSSISIVESRKKKDTGLHLSSGS